MQTRTKESRALTETVPRWACRLLDWQLLNGLPFDIYVLSGLLDPVSQF